MVSGGDLVKKQKDGRSRKLGIGDDKMIFMKGITLMDQYDTKEAAFDNIQKDILSIMLKLYKDYQFYGYYYSRKKVKKVDYSIALDHGNFLNKYFNLFKADLDDLKQGSSNDMYVLIPRKKNIEEILPMMDIRRIDSYHNIESYMLRTCPLIIKVSDSSQLVAYSESKNIIQDI